MQKPNFKATTPSAANAAKEPARPQATGGGQKPRVSSSPSPRNQIGKRIRKPMRGAYS